MKKLIEVKMEGITFKVQENMSFKQQNEFLALIEEHFDVKLKKLKETSTMTKVNSDLSTYLLLNIVKEPKITEEMLDDPDDPNADDYFVLGLKMGELGLKYMKKLMDLKRTRS